MRQLEWTREGDHHFGPFLYARSSHGDGFALIASSSDEDDRATSLRVSVGRHTVMMALPAWLIPPQRRKVFPGWDAATTQRLGRDWYWDIERRQFGVSLFEGHLSIKYGRQTHDSSTDKSKGWFLPWTQWRHVRYSVYHLDHTVARDFFERDVRRGQWSSHYEERRAFIDTIPKAVFEFKDFDGEVITATSFIEEREWRFGTKAFKWLSWFRQPKIRRSLDIHFSAETGRRKGSWKGGTIGHSIDIAPGESPEAAFRRYCATHDMTFLHPVEIAEA